MSQPKFVAVFDFDGTLIPKKYISCFTVMDKTLDKPHQEELDRIREQYLPKVIAGELTPEETKHWVTRSVQIYAESSLTIRRIREVFSSVNLRDGVTKTLQFLHNQNIPVAIVSYGIAQFIGAVLEEKKIRSYISQVYATHLIVQNGLVHGYYPRSFVFAGNKNTFSKEFALQHRVPVENILAIGDSAVDCNLGHLQENRLGIAKDQAEKEKIEKFFGEVVVTENFDPVLEWLIRKISP